MKQLNENDYQVSSWSGGQTIQLAIAPEGAAYADRGFLWRLSSATVELDESDFTVLKDYDRLILPLEGSMDLVHASAPDVTVHLDPYQVHAFDGAEDTHCAGRCTDFNLMMRKGACTGRITPVLPAPDGRGAVRFVPESGTEKLLLYCAKKSAAVLLPGAVGQLIEKESLLLEGEEIAALDLAVSPGGSVIAAEIRRIGAYT